MTRQEPFVEAKQALSFLAGLARDTEISHHQIKEVCDSQTWIENEGGREVYTVQPLQKLVDDSRLARPHFAREQDNTFPVVNAIAERCQRLPHALRHIQKTRVRVDVEWRDA